MARLPKPGTAGRGSSTGRHIMALLDLLGRRWTLRIVWELRQGRHSFRHLQTACDVVSPTVLNQRLKELREARLVDLSEEEGYGLTALGRELMDRFAPLAAWAERWGRATR